MTTPPYPELVAAIRQEGEGLLAAAALGLDPPVPGCDGWDVGALVRHIAMIYANVINVVTNRLTAPPEGPPAVPAGEPVAALRELLDELVATLADSAPDTPAWNWDDGDAGVAAFWARRMAHESSVHRFDAQAAHGMRQPIDAELAGDGLDEYVDLIVPRLFVRDGTTGPEGTVALASSDNGTWCLQLQPRGIERLDVLKQPDVTVTGTTSALLLACCSRVGWDTLEVDGDVSLLDRWTAALNF
ncbi:MAG TPA: maleylpyruvate isomerase N-terminal domain-containing protein [Mycobacteriales bacterium]|nr:maleylpyruvate isomerase N-terminal domain-containing protein [Mycobacteriales bacterium]